ncbi:Nramp family divalent metal transporter [Membranihabitans maritimus]|uniref:Nramp family divalent metal transporter n=1 Tax=Membranihabitans maritimus TaxID=2904244 RepID=UPI001F00EB53|nr:Nramp family divalent metal transporter [Membranihabitans maritimus]
MNPSTSYQQAASKIQNPPQTFNGKLKKLGPGFILSAAVVGSGELIATTTLGARAGFITFWVILVSCLVKVTLQMEFGKHAIYSGETVMTAFNKLPGPKIRKTNWSIWTWLFIQLFKLLQVGGIIGGVGIALNIAFPAIPVFVWAFIAAIGSSLLVYRGKYQSIEKISALMLGVFTLLTFSSLFAVQFTEYAISWQQISTGLSFTLPPAAVGVAISAFGITGIGGDEIMYYNYWCLEKGYAQFTGPYEDTTEWNDRARGWIKVMYLDAILSMVVYTLVTAAFYLLGASILHQLGNVPEGYETIETLSYIYTESLGPWAKSIYLLGAIIALFSTVFAALASWTRIFSDAFSKIGWVQFYDPAKREKSIQYLAWIFPLIWCFLYIFIKLPVLMVLIGGFSTSILLLIVVFAAYRFRYFRLPYSLKPSRLYDIFFWVSSLAILGVGIYSISKVL